MSHQIPLTPEVIADLQHPDDGTTEIAPQLAYRRLVMVNVVFYGRPGCGDRSWVLIDTGLPGLTGRIEAAAKERFGEGARPAAIILTHGHFDHVGGIEKLAAKWDAPIYAHELEHPYLTGTAAYPPPDPSVGGGMMALLSPLYPRGPIDVRKWLQRLPADGSIPGMQGWQWLHTPGHTAGHVSLWNESNRTIIAGDAFITTAQESAYSVATQDEEMHGPPQYFTPDWVSSKASVQMLARLNAELVVTGHGRAMRGAKMLEALQSLARDFDNIAVPDQGRYVNHPVRA